MALFTDLFVEKAANCRFGLVDKVLGSQFQLQSSHSGTDEDVREIHAGFVDVCREWLLHADGRTPSAEVALTLASFLLVAFLTSFLHVLPF